MPVHTVKLPEHRSDSIVSDSKREPAEPPGIRFTFLSYRSNAPPPLLAHLATVILLD
jgi:hypothetical protein